MQVSVCKNPATNRKKLLHCQNFARHLLLTTITANANYPTHNTDSTVQIRFHIILCAIWSSEKDQKEM